MQAVIDTIGNYYTGFIAFFTDAFASVKSFFAAILDTIDNYYEAFMTWSGNVLDSLRLFLTDFPLMLLKKLFGVFLWLFQWASDSCSYCLGGASNVGELANKMQWAWDTMATYSPGLIYVVNRTGVPEAFKILVCGMTVWAVVKTVMVIKAIL
jgi:hypothetical protein